MTKTVRTCGKLYLAGEYSVLTAGQGAILKNIPIYMTGKIHFSERYQLFSDMFDHTVDLTPDDEYSLIQDTVAVMNEFLQSRSISLRPFFLTITGKMEQDGKKFGLGSSGSVVVLTIRAITALRYLLRKPLSWQPMSFLNVGTMAQWEMWLVSLMKI